MLAGQTDWVRDVAWTPNVSPPHEYFATASQDRTVLVWTKDAPGALYVEAALDPAAAPGAILLQPGKFPDADWLGLRSLAGNIFAVSFRGEKVLLWKENLKRVLHGHPTRSSGRRGMSGGMPSGSRWASGV